MEPDSTRQKSFPLVSPLHPPLTKRHEYNKTRSRTASSVLLPSHLYYPQPSQNIYTSSMQAQNFSSRRTPSNATFSTFASSGNGSLPYRKNSEDLSRSTPTILGSRPPSTGYVAQMRKQKATVWCEHAQIEDPRLLAQLKAAKIRATKEIVGNPVKHRSSMSGSGSLTSSNRVTAKIRHHGKANLIGYSPGDLVGGVGGVPLRLSASEVEGYENNEHPDAPAANWTHRRTNSGRISNNHQGYKKGLTYLQQSVTNSMVGKWTGSSMQFNERHICKEGSLFNDDNRVRESTQRDSYVTILRDESRSTSSGSAEEKADSLPELYRTDTLRLAHPNMRNSMVSRSQSNKEFELRRMGSVDDRAITQNTGRLYIANPDVDSD